VDESKRGPYLMCAFVTEPASRKAVVAELNRIRPPKASRLHMKNESDPTKRAILSALSGLGVTSTVYVSRVKPFYAARAAIIERGIWPRMLTEGIDRLILEPEVGQDERDRRQLYRLAAATGMTGQVSYAHLPPTSEPMLWVPDAIAWAYGSGGEWRRRTQSVVVDVVDVDRRGGSGTGR
jgi:hypothetical protein